MTNFNGSVGSSEEEWIAEILSANGDNGDNLLPELDLRSRIEFGFRLAIPDVTGARGIGLWGPRIRAILPPKDVLTGRLLVYGHFSTN